MYFSGAPSRQFHPHKQAAPVSAIAAMPRNTVRMHSNIHFQKAYRIQNPSHIIQALYALRKATIMDHPLLQIRVQVHVPKPDFPYHFIFIPFHSIPSISISILFHAYAEVLV